MSALIRTSIKWVLISVRIPIAKAMTIAINWSLAKYSCPSWSSMTDESAIRSALAGLDDSGSSLHWWLGFWTLLVAVGVVLEVLFVVWEYRNELHDFKRGTVLPPARPHTILFILALLGAGLVAAGVSGELWEESKISTLETCIRKGDDALFLLLSKEAGDAKKSAKGAADASTVAKDQSDKAFLSASSALTKSERAEKSLGQAEDEANKAQAAASSALLLAQGARQEADSFETEIKAAKEKAAELDRRTRSRHLSPEQKLAFVNTLRVVRGETVDLSATSTGGDDALTLCEQLKPLFKKGGWTLLHPDNITTHLDFSISGVVIMAPKSLETPDGALINVTPVLAALQAAFRAVDLDATFTRTTRTDGIAEVVIGAKPIP
jgi:hypothetical protein